MKILLASALSPVLRLVWAQDDFGPQGPAVTMALAPVVTVVQGKPATSRSTFRVASGYHINSNQPKSEFLIPTMLKVEATTDIVIGKTTYPEGQDMSFAFDPDEKLNVYTGDFKVDVQVRPLHTVQAGKYVIRGTLKYQACDNAACYPPKQLPISFDVKIAKAPARAAEESGTKPARAPVVGYDFSETFRALPTAPDRVDRSACRSAPAARCEWKAFRATVRRRRRSANAGSGARPWWRALRAAVVARVAISTGVVMTSRTEIFRGSCSPSERRRRTSRSVKIPATRWFSSSTATAPTW